MEVRDPQAAASGEDPGEGFGGSVDELARAIDAHERLGFDDLIVQLEPKTTRSLDASPRRLSCGPADPPVSTDAGGTVVVSALASTMPSCRPC